jgi:hypothetical protein
MEAWKMADQSRSVVEAIDRVREALALYGEPGTIEFPGLAIEPVEQVLVFGSEDIVTLKDVNVPGKIPYFGSEGYLTDFSGRRIPGSTIQAALPVDPRPEAFQKQFLWPPEQPKPFDELPVHSTNTDVGFAKNSFSFGNGNSLVTVGGTLPKILRLENGGAKFWVTSCQVISQGTGRYVGARGIQSFSGSSYFHVWPESLEDAIRLLTTGFRAKIFRCIKLVLNENIAGSRAGALPIDEEF